MTDSERLEQIKQYVMDMSPVYRTAILLPDEEQAYNDGWDDAMYDTQKALTELIDGPRD